MQNTAEKPTCKKHLSGKRSTAMMTELIEKLTNQKQTALFCISKKDGDGVEKTTGILIGERILPKQYDNFSRLAAKKISKTCEDCNDNQCRAAILETPQAVLTIAGIEKKIAELCLLIFAVKHRLLASEEAMAINPEILSFI
jgi:hypothetical protein